MKKPIRVGLVRGAYLNNFEGQNYFFDKNEISLTGISSLRPIHQHFPFPVIRLFSLADIERISLLQKPFRYLANRLIGGDQILFFLEKYASSFDIFHTADPHYYYSYQLAKLRKKGKIQRLLVTSWETIPYNNESVFKKKMVKRYVLHWADKFLCHTEKARQSLIKEGVEKEKINLIRLGVDLTRFKPQKRANAEKITVLFVGRLVKEKGILDLYRAFRKVFTVHKNLRLIIVGQGKLKNKLRRLVGEDGLEKIIFLTQKNYSEMARVYRQADIFIFPSKTTKTWEEQYGMALIEAMASGLPIIAYRSGAIEEVAGKSGILVRENDGDGLAYNLEKLVNDRSLRIKKGKESRLRAEKYFDALKTARQIEKLYFSLWEGK